MNNIVQILVVVSGLTSLTAGVVDAGPELKLGITSPLPVVAGGLVQVQISMENLGANEAAGFQAFLQFDTNELQFVNGTYTSSPFGAAIISPIVANGNQIDLAAGINLFVGQMPTNQNMVLGYLVFTSVSGSCFPTEVEFRMNEPPTRLTTIGGDPIEPLTLTNIQPPSFTCTADITYDNVVGVPDLLRVINEWGACGAGCCASDLNGDLTVGVPDLLMVINHWGPCP